MIKCLTFASCGAHDPLHLAADRGYFPHLYSWLGFAQTPYALSSGAALQLRGLCMGEREVEPLARMLAYMETHQPPPATRHLVEASEVLFVELSTPVEPMIGKAVVNLNRVDDFVVQPLRRSSAPKQLISAWVHALVSVSPDLPERARALLEAWPSDLADAPLARPAVERLWSRRLSVEAMLADMKRLRHLAPGPMVMNLFHFRYLPDGRAVDWPAGFLAEQLQIAHELGAAVIDFAPLVQRLGVERTLLDEPGLNHLNPAVHPAAAEIVHDAIAGVLNRPFLRDDPAWRDEAPTLFAAMPELAQRPLRESLPETFVSGPPVPAPSTGRPTLQSVADRLNAALVALQHARLAALGTRESGLFNHYARLVAAGQLIGLRERRAAMVIENYLAEYDACAVMRAGLGELALLLAARGRAVLAFEPHPLRRAAIAAGAQGLADQGLIDGASFQIVDRLTPAAALDGEVLGVGLDVTEVSSLAQAAPFWPGIGHFAALLIDPRTFLTLRESPEEHEDLRSNLDRLGFGERDDYPFAALAGFERARDRRRTARVAPLG